MAYRVKLHSYEYPIGFLLKDIKVLGYSDTKESGAKSILRMHIKSTMDALEIKNKTKPGDLTVAEWLAKNGKGKIRALHENENKVQVYCDFKNEEDAALFKLTWF